MSTYFLFIRTYFDFLFSYFQKMLNIFLPFWFNGNFVGKEYNGILYQLVFCQHLQFYPLEFIKTMQVNISHVLFSAMNVRKFRTYHHFIRLV